MALGDTLVFQGTRYPRAAIADDLGVPSYVQDTRPRPNPRRLFSFAPQGNGRRWTATAPEGFWRDFCEIDLNDAESVIAFVRRRGDPHGDRHTGHWLNLQAVLGTATRAWEPEDAGGFSQLTTDHSRLAVANQFLGADRRPFADDLEVVRDPSGPGFALAAKSLAAFMAASAASALSRKVAMRRCEHCSSWFEAARRDVRFCSASCRTLNNVKG
jgi:hypothetical protein